MDGGRKEGLEKGKAKMTDSKPTQGTMISLSQRQRREKGARKGKATMIDGSRFRNQIHCTSDVDL